MDNPSETITPRQARRQFFSARRGELKKSSLRAYKFPTRRFVEYCEKHDVETVGEINNYVIESWKNERRDEVKLVTLLNNVKHLRVFVRWCENAGLLEYGTADRIQIPKVSKEGRRSDETLRLEQAEDVLRYLNTYEYGSRKHALFYTIWHTSCRISGAMSLDVEDFEPGHSNGPILTFRNRKAQGTPLKNGNDRERNVTISDDLATVLTDYIEAKREEVTDEFSRNPLFTTEDRRITRQRAYKDFTALTRPCIGSGVCPHDRDIDSCEAARLKKKAFGCPSSKSLHPIRRGSITYHINRGWPKEKLSERVDVSVDVLNDHYDARTKEQERQDRKQFLDLL